MPVFAAWRVGAPPSVLSLVQQELEGTYREGGQEAKGRGPADLLGQSSGRMGSEQRPDGKGHTTQRRHSSGACGAFWAMADVSWAKTFT